MCQFTPYYDPVIGRFITEDSYWGEASDPLSLNLYTYCHNNPIRYIDPTGHWIESDQNFSMPVQTELLKLTLAWYLAETQSEKDAIHQTAQDIREKFSSGFPAFINGVKKITEAACEEFAWFLGGSSSKWERDYMLDIVKQFQQDISVKENAVLKATMFLAGFISPEGKMQSWISRKTFGEINERLGKGAAQKFAKSMAKGLVGETGENGIKYLGKKGMEIGGKIFHYEIKIKGKYGAWRVLGNMNDKGQIIFDLLEKHINK